MREKSKAKMEIENQIEAGEKGVTQPLCRFQSIQARDEAFMMNFQAVCKHP
jgi:hypothetical protein